MRFLKKSRPKIGLALSSGAALGIAHIGVIKAFREADIPIDFIAGTSMGSIIGACFAKEGEIKEVEEEALKTDWRRFTRLLDPNINYLKKGLIYGQRIENLLRSLIGDIDFKDLKRDRRDWLVQTGARYIWSLPAVVEARQRLYENLSLIMPEPHNYVVDRIVQSIDKYVRAFNLFDSLTIFEAK